MSTDVIETAGLGKRYGSTWALRECSLAIPAGHVTALVGPNGAGKTTLLNLAVGLADPSAGSVTVLDGRPAGSPAALDGIAFVAQDMPVYKNLSAGDMLHLTANLNRRRELETGTFRYAWTQGIGRLRWTVGKLVPLAVAVTAVAGAFTVLFAWYNQPWVAAGYVTPFSARVFDLLGVAFAAWTLAAFAIGVLAGMLIRRAVPAIAATLAVYAALAFATGLWLREHYITPLATSSPNLPGSAWAISGWYTKGGTFAFGDHGNGIASTARQLCGGPCSGSSGSLEQILARHGYTHWISYQPGSRFWPFQWIEDGWLLALSVLLIAATVWLVRRRAA